MSPQYATPGVYIEEIAGPGVIAGVGTSTAAFIGPTARGPVDIPTRITSFDDFIRLYGDPAANPAWPYLYDQGRPYYLPFGVEGFFTNGGQYAYVLRIGTGQPARAQILNVGGEQTIDMRAIEEGAAGNGITVETELSSMQPLAQGDAQVDDVDGGGTQITVDDPTPFRAGDRVTDGADEAGIDSIDGDVLVLDAALPNVAQGDTLRIADLAVGADTFRVESTAGLHPDATALLGIGNQPERVEIASIDRETGFVTLESGITTLISLAGAAPTIRIVHSAERGSADVDATVDEDDQGQQVTKVDVSDAAVPNFRASDVFQPGDVVTSNGTDRGEIRRIEGDRLILDSVVQNIAGTVRIADLTPAQRRIRVADTTGLFPGTAAFIRGDDATNPGNEVEEFVEIEAVDAAGFVTLRTQPARAETYNLDVAAGAEPILLTQDFRLIITGNAPAVGPAPVERFEALSLDIFHPRSIFGLGVVDSELVTLLPPPAPSTSTGANARVVLGTRALQAGANDTPSALGADAYQRGLDILRDVDDVNMVCIPDAASHTERESIQQAAVNHCLALKERFAILDSAPAAPPSGAGSVEEQVGGVRAERGFAALYYPWLLIRDPTSTPRQPRRLLVPPSGHMAGIYARTDEARGVHKAPANTTVRGVLGLEQKLSDRQQGPLNLLGVNVLRIFPGSSQATVWGARTTVDPNDVQFVYINVRRLLNYIEESIAEGIRWAVFEPNDLILWQKLRRTITDFLTRVWRDGALFGATPEEAFQVRIDEALNPASTRELGRLYIEIKVAPVRPAEFIVVRISLWDGGSETEEV